MYAIIETGGKQYRVQQGDVIDVEKLDATESNLVEFKVLFLNSAQGTKIGSPTVANAVVRGQLLEEEVKGPKVIAFKYKKRKNYRRTVGHRQGYSRVKITEIVN